MGRFPLSGLAIVSIVAGAALVAGAGPANADTPDRYVNNAAGCSDAGAGTQTQPYCTIAAGIAAAAPGQKVNVTGTYSEHVTIAKSGITVQGFGLPMPMLNGPGAGFTVDGQHDVAISHFYVNNVVDAPALAMRDSTRIAVDNLTLTLTNTATVPVVRLAGVTDSTLTSVFGAGLGTPTALTLDAATSGVVVKSSTMRAAAVAGTRSIEILGSHNTILGSQTLSGGIVVAPGTTGNALINNQVAGSRGIGIDNDGATGTAITNNNLLNNCAMGIRVAGASSGVSVQNNVVAFNGAATTIDCGTAPKGTAEIGLFDGAAGTTVVDYNSVAHAPDGVPAAGTYSWNGTALGLDAFRTASGQAAHDLEGPYATTQQDSANSAAPGYQPTDKAGRQREDNPDRPNTGAGPVSYADRGALETVKGPDGKAAARSDLSTMTATVDASASTPGWVPIASYSFDWGDGTPVVTQTAPIASHHYERPGYFEVYVKVTDTNGQYPDARTIAPVSLWPASRTVAILADNGTYVSAGADGNQPLRAGSTTVGPGELFELVTADGSCCVALRSKVNGRYVANLSATDTQLAARASDATLGYGNSSSFVFQPQPDGSVALLSAGTNAYVSSNSGKVLTADRAAVGPWEKFHLIDAGNATVTLRAHANTRFVTADNGGNAPLIANRTATGQWETFDLVDAGNGWVALYSHANGKYVTAENGGNAALIANRTAIGAWEKFKVIKNADGSTSLQAGINGKYVTADNGGNAPLIANRTAIGPWEEFDRG
ncbi:PKD domain-containing protein [Dactylosporangium sp. CS-033363]|uniref:PKD domain-containing protein n=1 Tax=Dactylosporangium sp. CS-033363 TaxID=3239935 RepID=UPI003D9373FA